MRALVMVGPGGVDQLQLREVPPPVLTTATQVLVQVKAAGVNPIDTKLRQRGTFYPEEMPAILGCDGAGVVVAIAPGVTDFQVGDEVYYCAGGLGRAATGNYGEYAVVESHWLAPKPKNLSFAEAAAVPLVWLTAWESLSDRLTIQPGQKVLIHGGAGGVGHVAIQIAKLLGAEVITTVGSAEKAEFVKRLGADATILYKDQDFVEAVQQWTHGQGVDAAFDTVGGDTFFQTVPAVKYYGDLVTILEPKGSLKAARDRNLRIGLELMLTPALANLQAAQQYQGQLLRQAAPLFETGEVKIHMSEVLPLEAGAIAHERIEAGSTMGKIVLTLD